MRGECSLLRPSSLRRRKACDSVLSSGQSPVTGGERITGTPTPLRRVLTGGKHHLLPGTPSPEVRRAQIAHLRGDLARRRTASDSAPSSGQQPVTGGKQITGTPTPLRRALTGGKHQLRAGLASPELKRTQISHLRGELARRRTASVRSLSSGQHSLTGGDQITGTPTPSRRALTGGKHQLLPGTPSPEVRRAQKSHLRRALARRRIACDSALSSGQRPVTGGQQITDTPPPTKALFVGGGRHRRAGIGSLCKKFLTIFDTFSFTNYTYRGIIICIQPKLKNFVK